MRVENETVDKEKSVNIPKYYPEASDVADTEAFPAKMSSNRSVASCQVCAVAVR